VSQVTVDQPTLIWAARYALGRSSYCVGMVCDEIRKNVAVLRSDTVAVLRRDIAEAMERGNVGMDMDRREWERLDAVLAERQAVLS
jgi:hypothetical protein